MTVKQLNELSRQELAFLKGCLESDSTLSLTSLKFSVEVLAQYYLHGWSNSYVVFSELAQGFAIIEMLAWDTSLLGIECVRIHYLWVPEEKFNQQRLKELKALCGNIAEFLDQKNIQLTDIKISSHSLFGVRALEEIGFHTIDSLLTLGLNKKELEKAALANTFTIENGFYRFSNDLIVRLMTSEEEPILKRISEEAFSDTEAIKDRFFLEPVIDPERARTLFSEWFKNSAKKYYDGQGLILTALWQNQPVGYIAIERNKTFQNLWYDSLNAVDKGYRGKRIYRALVQSAHKAVYEQGAEWLITKTQISTERVINTWLHLGARLLESHITLHWTKA